MHLISLKRTTLSKTESMRRPEFEEQRVYIHRPMGNSFQRQSVAEGWKLLVFESYAVGRRKRGKGRQK
jgi:hypothetical protein